MLFMSASDPALSAYRHVVQATGNLSLPLSLVPGSTTNFKPVSHLLIISGCRISLGSDQHLASHKPTHHSILWCLILLIKGSEPIQK